MKCPSCYSTRLRKSNRGNAHLVFPFRLFVVWVRCRDCGWAFRQFGLLPGNKISAAAHERRRAA